MDEQAKHNGCVRLFGSQVPGSLGTPDYRAVCECGWEGHPFVNNMDGLASAEQNLRDHIQGLIP